MREWLRNQWKQFKKDMLYGFLGWIDPFIIELNENRKEENDKED